MFFDSQKYVYPESLSLSQYTIRWDKTQMLKKFPSDKINSS